MCPIEMPRYRVVFKFSGDPALGDTITEVDANSESEAIMKAEEWFKEGFPADALKDYKVAATHLRKFAS